VISCTFGQAYDLSNRLAYALQHKLGLQREDRVAILMSQSIETALVHMSAYKAGGIAVPLFILFGPEALEYRLQDSGARVVFVEQTKLDEVLALKASGKLPELKHIVVAPPLSAMRYEQLAPQVEKQTMFQNSTSTQPSSSSAPDTVAQVHHLSSLLARSSSNFTPVRTKLDDPAIIIYTSGVSG
jgi:acetyl-CoA synthetase